MPPKLAFISWLFLLLGLLYFDPAKQRKTSLALWIPIIWLFFVGSRMPSTWLGGHVTYAAAAYEESDSLNQVVLLGLTLLAVAILILRSFRWDDFFKRNLFLMVFLSFALASVFWSDYPLVTVRRWFRDLGIYLVILLALSDRDPLEAVRTLLRRFSYLIIPLSVMLVKYFPELSRGYDPWTGVPMAFGAATDKNMLGAACMVAGIFFAWDIVTRWPQRSKRQIKRILLVDAAFMWMTIWLLNQAKSATSSVCMAIATAVILFTASKTFWRHTTFSKLLIPTCFCSYVILAYGFNLNQYLVGAVGRDPTLTNRTAIWATLLTMKTNPLVGTGYRSFFLGDRLQAFWMIFPGINEAHNGYLDIYLTLGIIGLIILIVFLIASYHTIWTRFRSSAPLASLGLAFWTALLFYNITEAGFVVGVLWMSFILTIIGAPGLAEQPASSVARLNRVAESHRLPTPVLGPHRLPTTHAPRRSILNTPSLPARKT